MASFEEALAGMRQGETWTGGTECYRFTGDQFEKWDTVHERWEPIYELELKLAMGLYWGKVNTPKTITLYRPIYKERDDSYCCGDSWCSTKGVFMHGKIVAWEERTVEVSE